MWKAYQVVTSVHSYSIVGGPLNHNIHTRGASAQVASVSDVIKCQTIFPILFQTRYSNQLLCARLQPVT